jgi:hypothetical protein
MSIGCADYDRCRVEANKGIRLANHVLNRITFGPTVDLLLNLRTQDELVAYIEDQLDSPTDYDAKVHEPELFAFEDNLPLGFERDNTIGIQHELLASTNINYYERSAWQLLHR